MLSEVNSRCKAFLFLSQDTAAEARGSCEPERLSPLDL
jgi:hypothetical protein